MPYDGVMGLEAQPELQIASSQNIHAELPQHLQLVVDNTGEKWDAACQSERMPVAMLHTKFPAMVGNCPRVLANRGHLKAGGLQVGVFQMDGEGLHAVSNPSALFLSDRLDTPGVSAAVTVTMEGTRPLLAEIQALCSPARIGAEVSVFTMLHKVAAYTASSVNITKVPAKRVFKHYGISRYSSTERPQWLQPFA